MVLQSEILSALEDRLWHEIKSDGLTKTALSWLSVYKFSKDTVISGLYEPSLCIILRGKKSVQTSQNQERCFKRACIFYVATHIPTLVRISAPYLAIKIALNPDEIASVLSRARLFISPIQSQNAFSMLELNDNLLQVLYRAIKLLTRKKSEREFLASSVLDEIIFTLVNSEIGAFLSAVSASAGIEAKIAQASRLISHEFSNKIKFSVLARELDMSQSSFNHHFKRITTLTPAEFLKRTRLLNAKELLKTKHLKANEVAFMVGYNSPSHFSREYLKMFGVTPMSDSVL